MGRQMSDENVEIVRAATQSFNENGADGFIAYCDPDVEWQTTGRFADSGVYRGHAGIRRAFEEFREDVGELQSVVEDAWAAGDSVVVSTRLLGRGAQGDVPIDEPLTYLVTLRAGRIIEIRTFVRTEEALEAAGLGA
jgi:ketosteroid isomerase-like protein